MSYLRNVCFASLVAFGLLTLSGCGESGNTVIEQPEEIMTPEYMSEESAVGSGEPTDS